MTPPKHLGGVLVFAFWLKPLSSEMINLITGNR